MDHLQILQNNAAQIILDKPKYCSAAQALEKLKWDLYLFADVIVVLLFLNL